MQWIGISGSWRATSKQIENDVRRAVKKIILNGDGIVAGGALNVDSFALDEALEHDPKAKQIKIYLPTTLELYATHYRKRAKEGVITNKQAEQLITQLSHLKKIDPQALKESNKNITVNQKTYYQRHKQIVKASNKLIAFQVNKSAGTQDTIEKAKRKGLPVTVFSYKID